MVGTERKGWVTPEGMLGLAVILPVMMYVLFVRSLKWRCFDGNTSSSGILTTIFCCAPFEAGDARAVIPPPF